MKPFTALHNWQTAQAQLETALDTFIDACATLQLACSEGGTEVESVVERLCNRLDRLSVMSRKLAASRATAFQIRNDSPSVVPITKLPLELLVRLFAFCVKPCPRVCRHYKLTQPPPLGTITRVCTRWRQAALSAPSLWSLVVIDDEPAHGHTLRIPTTTRLWLERAAGAPIILHIRSITGERMIQQLVPILQPHLPRVARLAFHEVQEEFVDALLNSPQNQGSRVALSALCLDYVWGLSRTLEQPIWQTIRSLQELELVNLEWDICPQPEQLAMALARCPDLRILRVNLPARYSRTSINYPNVHLPALRQLDIGTLVHPMLRELLSILQPGHLGLKVMLGLPIGNDDETILPIKRFLHRSNIAVLRLQPPFESQSPGFEHYLENLSQCHTMTLEFSHREVMFDTRFTLANLPKLRVLNILGGNVGYSSWTEIIRISETLSLTRIAFSKSVVFAGLNQEELKTCDWSNELRQRVGEVVFLVDDFYD